MSELGKSIADFIDAEVVAEVLSEQQKIAAMGASAKAAGKTLQDNPFRCGWQRRVWIMGFNKAS